MEEAVKVLLGLDVDDYARYVIAKYFVPAATTKQDKLRARASRAQVRRFVEAAIQTAVRTQQQSLRKRYLTTAARLAEGRQRVTVDLLPPTAEEQRSLQW